MGEEADLTTLGGRIKYVWATCGYATQSEFAAALGVSSQSVTNWSKRRSLGRDGPPAINRVTGVSTDWLRTGHGVAFPTGPIEAPKKARIEAMADDLDEVRALLSAIVSTIAVTRPDVAPELAEAVQVFVKGQGRPSRWIQDVQKTLEAAPRPRRRAGRA